VEFDDKRFLVVGGAGFVGSHVVHLLAREPVREIVVFDKTLRRENIASAVASGKVKTCEGDVAQADAVARVMQGIDGLFHLAALPINACVKMPRSCFDINVVGTFNVLEAAQKAGVKKLVFSSASAVYGDTNELMDENHPLNTRTLYGSAKVVGEYFLRAFREMYGLDYVVLRYMNVYGPGQQGGVVMSALNRIQQNLPPVIYGDGSQSFDFVHVRDVAQANLLAMQKNIAGEVFNVGSGTEVSVRDIVALLLELSGSSLQPHFEPTAQVLMQRRVGSSEKARRLLGFAPKIDLRAGLVEVINASDRGISG